MVQGAENDLADIRFFTVESPVIFNRDNDPFNNLNNNSLIVDNKAILARDTAVQAQIDLAAHIGTGGVPEHAGATPALSGFLPTADKTKLDFIQAGAQLNILAPVDAIELISRKPTTLHKHLPATAVNDGFLSAVAKTKLDTIELAAQVNNLTPAQAATLTSGGNADTEHTHNFVGTAETFTEAVHLITDHAGIPGIGGFTGFIKVPYESGPSQVNPGVTVFTKSYDVTDSFTSLHVVTAGLSHITDFGWWGRDETFLVTGVSVVGTDGIVTYEVVQGGGSGDMQMRCWQGGYGL